jgi:hypothetical protein
MIGFFRCGLPVSKYLKDYGVIMAFGFDSFADIQAFRTRITLALVRAFGTGRFIESIMD